MLTTDRGISDTRHNHSICSPRRPHNAVITKDSFLEILCNASLLWEGRRPLNASVAFRLDIPDHGLIILSTVGAVAVWAVTGLDIVVDIVWHLFLVVWPGHVWSI